MIGCTLFAASRAWNRTTRLFAAAQVPAVVLRTSNFQKLPSRSPAYRKSMIPSVLMSAENGCASPLGVATEPVADVSLM
ncbi:hypothetical protein D3C83_80480 [compost metagenome]